MKTKTPLPTLKPRNCPKVKGLPEAEVMMKPLGSWLLVLYYY
jgi:hypothetical protein